MVYIHIGNYSIQPKKWIFFLLTGVLLVFPFSTAFPQTSQAHPLAATSLLKVTFIDVGQGDSILLEAPDGQTALIDGGDGNGSALAYLQKLGIDHLNLVIATHPHEDHIGGLVEVMNALSVDNVWTSGASTTAGFYEKFLDAMLEKKIPYHEAKTDSVIPFGSLQFNVLYAASKAENLNNTSLVLHLSYGTVSFLFTGDADSPVENELLRSEKDHLASTILKVGHHGSNTSSTPAFLTAVHPAIAVYSAGQNNIYGHPHQVALDNLAKTGAVIYGTNVYGTIMVTTDGATYTIHTEITAPPVKGSATTVTPATQSSPTKIPAAAGVQSTATPKYVPTGPDKDCKDFATRAEAQSFYIVIVIDWTKITMELRASVCHE